MFRDKQYTFNMFYVVGAFAQLQKKKKRLLASSCLSVRLSACPSVWNLRPTGRIFVKFDI